MSSSAVSKFYGYPKVREGPNTAYDPKIESNPVIGGSLLSWAAALVTSIESVQKYLWSNAGFNGLRNLESLVDYPERFDPTVVSITSNTSAARCSYTDPSEFQERHTSSTQKFYTIADYHNLYRSGRATPLDVVQFLLPLIRRDLQTRNPHSTAFIDTQVHLVLAAAQASSQRYKEGKFLGILDGVPVAVKDEVHVDGYRTTKGMKFDEDHQSIHNETEWPVKKWEEAGAVLLGKLNMHELGTDTTNNNHNWGTPRNPFNNSYYTGGSSGGPGYVVAAGLAPIVLGADGGGSIRLPATFCGIYGLKPSHGRVGDTKSTVTVLGPLASSIADLEIAYRVMATPDPSHPVCSLFRAPERSTSAGTKLLGICEEWFDRADPQVQKACRATIDYLVTSKGYTLISISLPYLSEGQKAHNLTILSEFAVRVKASASTKSNWTSRLSAANKILLSVGSQTPATDYLLAQQLRQLHMSHLAFLFQKHHGLLIVTPTAPIAGYPIRSESDLTQGVSNGNTTVRSMEYIWLANWTGCPALSCPVGYAKPEQGQGDLPVGLMAMGEWGSEDVLIEWGRDVEDALDDVGGGRRRGLVWEDVIGAVQK